MSIPRTRSPATGRPERAWWPACVRGLGETGTRSESTSWHAEIRPGGKPPRSKRLPDPLDERILRLLVRNARLTWREVGDEVGLSANAVAQRVRRLEGDGWIRGYSALLDPGLAEQGATALVQLRAATDLDAAEFE